MVRYWKYTKAFFRLIRFPNLLIIAITMVLLRWLVVLPLLGLTGFSSQIPNGLFVLFVLSTMCIAAAGYVINDYFDRKADLINRPGRVILGRILSRRAGMFWHIVLNFIGIALGVYVSYRLGLLKYSVVFVFISGLLWFYSTTYKKQVLLGNVVVAFMVAMVPIIILMYELPLVIKHYRYFIKADNSIINQLAAWIVGYSIFAFLLTFIREIVKDIEDFEGDFAFGRQTIPIAWGVDTAKIITFTVSVISLGTLGFVVIKFFHDITSIIYSVVFIILPLLYFIVKFSLARSKSAYHRCSLILKGIMVAGLLYLVVAYFFVF